MLLLGAFQIRYLSDVAIYYGSKESVNCRYDVKALRNKRNKNVLAP